MFIWRGGNPTDFWVAKYWKNGQSYSAQMVQISPMQIPLLLRAAMYMWQDRNTTGRFDVAKYWKNGQGIALTNGSTYTNAYSIAVVGSDVYVAGYENNVAKYWKNSIPVIPGDVSTNSKAYAIFLVSK